MAAVTVAPGVESMADGHGTSPVSDRRCDTCSPDSRSKAPCGHGTTGGCVTMTSCTAASAAEMQSVAFAHGVRATGATPRVALSPLHITLAPDTPPPRA